MNRALLCSAMEGLSSRYGYSFTIGDSLCYPTTISNYPAAFMFQPEFDSHEGRRHGRITYKVTLRVARQAAKLSPSERNELFNQMEEDLTDMFIGLSQSEFVAAVKSLTIKSISEVDRHGAVAMEAQSYVETIF